MDGGLFPSAGAAASGNERGRRREPTPPYGTPVVEVASSEMPSQKERAGSAAAGTGLEHAVLNARLGLLAALSGSLRPAGGRRPQAGRRGLGPLGRHGGVRGRCGRGGETAGRELRMRPSGRTRLRQDGRLGEGSRARGGPPTRPRGDLGRGHRGPRAYRPLAGPEVLLALMPMSMLKALLGFLTFLSPSGSAAGRGHLVVRTAARLGDRGCADRSGAGRADPAVLNEQQMLTAVSGWWRSGPLGVFVQARWSRPWSLSRSAWPGRPPSPGLRRAGAAPRPDLDQGRAFARFETRLQLMWVVGSFVPVVLSLPIPAGNTVIAVAGALGAVSYMSSLRAVREEPEWLVPLDRSG